MVRTIGIVSLSSGIIGEPGVRWEMEIGAERLRRMGLSVRFMPNALNGAEDLKEHPEKRAEDLLAAFLDPEIDMIMTAIGGDDTYRLLPYLFDHGELAGAVRNKVFLGFSDTTINHFMLRKVGLRTFYGQAFLPDICEIGRDMLPYTRTCFEELVSTGTIREITPSPLWYEERSSFDPALKGREPVSHSDQGFQLLQGRPVFSGPVFGGCIDSMYDCFDGERYPDMPVLCQKYHLFPDAEEWRGRILLLESSEEKMPPAKYEKALRMLKETGIFRVVSGVLAGKPIDRVYEKEYCQLLTDVIGDPDLPIVANIPVGHAQPRCIIPFGPEATVDAVAQRIVFSRDTADV